MLEGERRRATHHPHPHRKTRPWCNVAAGLQGCRATTCLLYTRMLN
nr:hypothetical protein [Candidatus Sigynarchaeota archaeon]